MPGSSASSACRSNQFPRAIDLARAVSRGRHPGRHRRVPRVAVASRCCPSCRADLAAAQRARRHPLRRRGRRPDRRALLPMRSPGELTADLQLPERSARPAAAGHPVPAARRSCGATARRSAPSTPGAAARSSAASARSSMCRAASRATATPTTSSALVRANLAQGVNRFFITDDNFARNQNWEAIFDRLIELREQEGLGLQLHDPGRYAVPPDSEFRREGGARRRASGCSSASKTSTPTICVQAKKQQNRITSTARCSRPGARTAGHHLCRLHPGVSRRHAGVDRARHPHHAAGAAGRSARVLHSDAAARLGRPPGARTRTGCGWTPT